MSMLKGRSSHAVFSEVPFMYGKETLTRVSVVGLFCSSDVQVVGLLLYLLNILLIKCIG